MTPSTGPALGGVLSTLEALGPAPASDWPGTPLPGNDFLTRFDEDLALLADLGVSAVRLGLDWARLQPAPGRVDDDWREWYANVLLSAQHHGINVWLALHEHTVPAWFDDEGSFADGKATGLLWPRWVELAAELFGDRVSGWFPIVDPVGTAARWAHDPRKHEDALVNLAVAWRDSWRVLHGGPPVATALAVRMVRPVDQTVPAQQAARLEDHLRWRLWLRALRDGVVRLPNGRDRQVADLGASLDVLGVCTALDVPEGATSDEALRRWEERLGTVLRRAAEEGPDRPIALAALSVSWPNADERSLYVDSCVASIGTATHDGVNLTTVFVDPAIGASQRQRVPAAPLVDRDRNQDTVTGRWRALAARD